MSLILLPNPIQNMIESYYWSVQHSTKFTDIGIPAFREFSSNQIPNLTSNTQFRQFQATQAHFRQCLPLIVSSTQLQAKLLQANIEEVIESKLSLTKLAYLWLFFSQVENSFMKYLGAMWVVQSSSKAFCWLECVLLIILLCVFPFLWYFSGPQGSKAQGPRGRPSCKYGCIWFHNHNKDYSNEAGTMLGDDRRCTYTWSILIRGIDYLINSFSLDC